MSTGRRFLILDVFAEAPFGGNQLGVFPDAGGLSTAVMQSLARELNFAETTFVLPPTDGKSTKLVRIFTPGVELPFAGHPTLGTAAALAHEGVSGGGLVTLEEKAGPVQVAIGRRGDSYFCEMTLERNVDMPEEPPDRPAVAAALSVEPGAIRDAWFAGIPVRFCFVELAGKEIVDAAALDRAAWKRGMSRAWAAQLFFFSRQGNDLYARMFAPGFGVEEDPATGSAAAALAASLARRTGAGVELHIEQGVAMGRPSRIYARASGGKVQVGGGCRIFAEGTAAI